MMTGEGSVKSGTLPQFFVYACLFVSGHRLSEKVKYTGETKKSIFIIGRCLNGYV